MSLTFTTSLRAAADSPACEPRTVFELESTQGLYRLATEVTSWGGALYSARVLDSGEIVGGLGAQANALPSPKSVSFTVGNPDGFWSRLPIDTFRQQIVTVRDIFADVSTPAARSEQYMVTGGAMPDGTTYRFVAEDLLARYRRVLIPRTECLITKSMYPNCPKGSEGRVIPMPFGRSYVPCHLVDQTSFDIFVVCVGTGTVASGGLLVELWNGGFSPVVKLVTSGNPSSFPYSLQYATRMGVPVTEVVLATGVPIGNPPTPHFLDLTWPSGSEYATPDRVLTELLFGHFGACVDQTYVDSDALVVANAYYRANSICMDGALTEQAPLEDWLGAWQHDAMAYLLQREKIVVAVQNSRAPVGSIHVGNIMEGGTLRMADRPITAEEGKRVLRFRDRTKDPGPGFVGLTGGLAPIEETDGLSFQTAEAGSGSEVLIVSPFIGRPSVAKRVANYWAQVAFHARRSYGIDTTVKLSHVEEADLLTLTHSLLPPGTNMTQVTEVRRRGGKYSFQLQQTSHQVFEVPTLPTDPDFIKGYQRIPYTGSYEVNQFTNYFTAVSHQLAGTPLSILPVWSRPDIENVQVITLIVQNGGGLGTTNNSQFIVFIDNLDLNRVRLDQYLIGWDLRLFAF